MPVNYVYQTEKQSAAIREYFRINRQVLNLVEIEKQAGLYDRCLHNFLTAKSARMSPENIEKLMYVLRKLGFEMLSISAEAKHVVYAVCKLSGIPFEQMLSDTQKHYIIEEKQILIYLLIRHTKEKQADIAKLLHRKDCNISLALKRITGLIEVDPKIKEKVKKYEQAIFKNL